MTKLGKFLRACLCATLCMGLLGAQASYASATAATQCGATFSVQASLLTARIRQESANAIKGDNATSFATLKAQRKELQAVLTKLKTDPIDGNTSPLMANFQSLDRNLSTLIEQENALRTLALTITKMKAMESQLTDLPEEIVTLTALHNGLPKAVMAATQLLYLNQRLMRNIDTLYANDHIEPEVSFFIGKDSAGIQTLTQALLHGSTVLGLAAPHPQTRVALERWAAAYSELEHHITATRKVLQHVLVAKRALEALHQDNAALLTQLTPL